MQTSTVFDLNNTACDKLVYEMKKIANSDGVTRYYGPVMYENKQFRTRTPYLRTPLGLSDTDFGGRANKSSYFFEMSLLPTDLFDKCLGTNTSNVEKFKNFILAAEQAQKLYILENFDTLVKLPEDFTYCGMPFSPDVLMDKWNKSIIKESDDGYPPKVKLNFTKQMRKGELEGALVMEQKFDHDNKQFVFKTEKGKQVVDATISSISKISKHAHVRIQAALYSYFTFDSNEPEKSNYGFKWVPEQIVFINNPNCQPKEIVFNSFNFNDIVPQHEFKPLVQNPELKLIITTEANNPLDSEDSQPDQKRVKCE